MLTEWTTPFIEAKPEFVAWLKEQDWTDYQTLLKKSIEIICDRVEFDYGEEPDPTRIHVIDDGDYQGTLLFVVGAADYQPSAYWYTTVSYGSCSGCDALEDAWDYGDPSYEAVYMLTLHMLQKAKRMEN